MGKLACQLIGAQAQAVPMPGNFSTVLDALAREGALGICRFIIKHGVCRELRRVCELVGR